VVIENWRREILLNSNVKESRIVLLNESGKKRAEALLSATEPKIFITNYESLTMPSFVQAMEARLLFAGPKALVLDESHKIKSCRAKRTKTLLKMASLFTYKYILTGTPILNDLMDIYSQVTVMDNGYHFGKNEWAFRNRYFFDKNRSMPRDRYFPDWRPVQGAENKIKELIAPFSMYVEKKSCIDLPPLIKTTVHVPLSKEQERLYKSMKEDYIATVLEGGKVKATIAEHAMTKALRLQQIVSGHVKVEGEDTVLRIKDNPRKEALYDLLEDIAFQHKVIVWAVFKANYADIREVCEELKLKYVELTGDTKDKQAEIDKFNTDESVRVCIGHPGAGGVGANLTAASYSIFYTRSFSLEFDVQAEARNYRGGSEVHEKITRIDIVTPGTIDEICLKALAEKQEVSDKVIKDNMSLL
jgi:SNF2 family DNA or RNA helicase